MALLTVRELRTMKDGDRLSESAGRGQGTLRFRKTGGRIRVYFRATRPDGSRDELPVGWYDEKGRDGWTLDRIRKEAAEMRERLQSGSGDVRADLDAERKALAAEELARQHALEEAKRKALERERYTLAALCDSYVALLESRGKASSKHAKSMFKHIPGDLALLPANEITPFQVAATVRKVREAGKERAAGVLRSYLRAAYGAAIRAPFDSDLPADLIPFNVELNPVDAVPAIGVRAGNRTLSSKEMQQYTAALGDGIVDQALRLALLAGGQRMAQLLRAHVNDWDQNTGVLRLWDTKGKRKDAREHLLPLGPKGTELVESLICRAHDRADENDNNPSLFLSTGNARVLASTPGKRLIEIAKSIKGEPFNLRDIRRTVETMLAGLGISRDTRAQLLSHGIAGVQAVHYDRYSYIEEKRTALARWEQHLESIQTGETDSNVVQIKRAAST